MRIDNRSIRLAAGAALLFLLLLSLGLCLLSHPWGARVLFFPERTSGKLVGERRFLPPRRRLGAAVELYVEELILGPSNPALERLASKLVAVQSVIDRQGSVYVSLSREIMNPSASVRLDFEGALQAIADGVLYNFPRIRKLYLLVEGQIPGQRHAEGFGFDKKMLK